MQIMIIDDDKAFCLFLKNRLSRLGHVPRVFHNGVQALELTANELHAFEVSIIDMNMPEVDGLTTGLQLKERAPHLVTVVLTGYSGIEEVVKAFRDSHFDDYLSKPKCLDPGILEDLLLRTQTLLAERKALSNEYHLNQFLRLQSISVQHELVGHSAVFRQLLAAIHRVSLSDSTVLIRGETGTGKSVIARELHQQGQRRQEPFVAINCSTLPGELLESELFGHVKGAFTGALGDKPGLFVLANGGTIFLDEIGDMPLALQSKLLQVLQERRVRPVGGTQEIPIDVRLVSATHQPLEERIKAGAFREDLFYRLNVIPLHVPALRERAEDIELLASTFLERKHKLNPRVKGFSQQALQMLQGYPWPGNIRELHNRLERALVWAQHEWILPEDLGFLPNVDSLTPRPPSSPSLPAPALIRSVSTASHEGLPSAPPLMNDDPEALWLLFREQGSQLWQIQDQATTHHRLKEILEDAYYLKKQRFGRIVVSRPQELGLQLRYLNVTTNRWENFLLKFIFLPEQSLSFLSAPAQEVLSKGLPDSSLFSWLYPTTKRNTWLTPSPAQIARALILREAQTCGERNLKALFRRTMPCVISPELAQGVRGLTTHGADALAACLLSPGALFAGVSSLLRANPEFITQEIRKIFPQYQPEALPSRVLHS